MIADDKCNLIINYLPQFITDDQLKSLFAEHGEIVHAKVVRDRVTKKSLGYGFVKFLLYDDAKRSVELKSGFVIGDKVLKVSFARVPSENIRNCKLYITNLPRLYTDADMHTLFAQFGDIIECRILKDGKSGFNKGVAFVQFNVRDEASRAISALNGYQLDGADRPLIVKYAEEQRVKGTSFLPPSSPIGRHVNGSSGNYQFPSSYAPTGHPYQGVDGQAFLPVTVSMPYGYPMKYTTMQPTMAVAGEWYPPVYCMTPTAHLLPHAHGLAYEQLDQRQFHPQSPRTAPPGAVYMAAPRPASDAAYNGSVTVILNRLPPNADVAMLHDLFSPYGRILSAHVDTEDAVGGDGRRGSHYTRAYIQMESIGQAQNAVQAISGSMLFNANSTGDIQIQLS